MRRYASSYGVFSGYKGQQSTLSIDTCGTIVSISGRLIQLSHLGTARIPPRSHKTANRAPPRNPIHREI